MGLEEIRKMKSEYVKPLKGQLQKASPKRKAADKLYNKNVNAFKKNNLRCKALLVQAKCTGWTNDVHHMKGKATVELLLDEDNWLPVCRNCHNYLETYPREAVALGLSISRIQL